METHVYYVCANKKTDHEVHFDVFTTTKDTEKATQYAKEYLKSVNKNADTIDCDFCHSHNATPAQITDIGKKGYSILPLSGLH